MQDTVQKVSIKRFRFTEEKEGPEPVTKEMILPSELLALLCKSLIINGAGEGNRTLILVAFLCR
jgi:hypothetical protein